MNAQVSLGSQPQYRPQALCAQIAPATIANSPIIWIAPSSPGVSQPASVIFTGQSQVERRPAYLQARRDGTDVVASWQGVGRLGGGANVAMGVQFAGYTVTITDGTTTQAHDTADTSYTGSLAAFTGPITVRVHQRNNLTGPGPNIEVTIP